MTYSALASPRATRDVLAEHGLATKKSLGQHFLVDDNIVGRILALAGQSDLEGRTVLEVGPGIGTLTLALCDRVGSVVAVERDRELEPVLATTLAGCPHHTVLFDDAIRISADSIAAPYGPPTALIANLPYAVAATVVLRFFQELESLRYAVVMVQAEVADRMTASPGIKDYGSYSVKLQLLARPKGRFSVARTCFLPPPRVDSAVVRLDRREDLAAPHVIEAASSLADIAFAQRRKTLRNTLKAGLAGGAQAADALLSSAGIDGGRRAETLSVGEYVEMAEKALERGLLP